MLGSRRERALIGVAVVVVALLLGYVYVVEPLRDWSQSLTEVIPAREKTLERRRAFVAQRPGLEAELTEANKLLAQRAARWLQGPTPPLAASELQTLVKDLAVQAGAEVRSERILPLIDRGEGLQEVPIEITVASNLRETVRLLYDLAHTSKTLTVQDVKVRVVSVGQPRDLLTTFTVSGYLLPGAQAPAAQEPPKGSRG